VPDRLTALPGPRHVNPAVTPGLILRALRSLRSVPAWAIAAACLPRGRGEHACWARRPGRHGRQPDGWPAATERPGNFAAHLSGSQCHDGL